jgi:hypothetical protein
MKQFRNFIFLILVFANTSYSFTIDSLFEPVLRSFQLLPDYYLRFDISTFAFHQDAFFERQYLAEPHPQLEFCFASYKDLIASVWQVDFQFGLGKVPGDNVFTVLNVAFGIDPAIELRLKELNILGGMAHRCFHGIDRTEYPIAYYNKLFLIANSKNFRLNTYWHELTTDSSFSLKDRIAWNVSSGYFLRNFPGVSPGKLNGNNPLLWEISDCFRYAFYHRKSWFFTLRTESTAGVFSKSEGYHVTNDGSMYWKLSFGTEAYFTRGKRGGCFYVIYNLDDLPASQNEPSFSLGHPRFSRNRLAQIGLIFFN